jgi:hypothetical protein
MTSLEIAGRFPPDADLEAAWRSGIEAFKTNRHNKPRSRP